MQVTVLAGSSSVHDSYSGSEDVYLVEVEPKEGKPFLGRLVDSYPLYQAGLPDPLIAANAQFTVAMERDPACDTTTAGMHFPGRLHVNDILAQRRQPTDPSAGDALEEWFLNSPIRCFATVHTSWKYTGHQQTEMWWR